MANYNLTTGQMIDKLQKNEIAVGSDGIETIYLTKRETKHDNGIFHCQENGKEPYDIMTINSWINKFKWEIRPKVISFIEAMKALEEGVIVQFKPKNSNSSFRFRKENEYILMELCREKYTFEDLMEGEWTIPNISLDDISKKS